MGYPDPDLWKVVYIKRGFFKNYQSDNRTFKGKIKLNRSYTFESAKNGNRMLPFIFIRVG